MHIILSLIQTNPICFSILLLPWPLSVLSSAPHAVLYCQTRNGELRDAAGRYHVAENVVLACHSLPSQRTGAVCPHVRPHTHEAVSARALNVLGVGHTRGTWTISHAESSCHCHASTHFCGSVRYCVPVSLWVQYVLWGRRLLGSHYIHASQAPPRPSWDEWAVRKCDEKTPTEALHARPNTASV